MFSRPQHTWQRQEPAYKPAQEPARERSPSSVAPSSVPRLRLLLLLAALHTVMRLDSAPVTPGIDTQSPRSLLSARPVRYHGLRNPDTASEGSAYTADSLATSATGSPDKLRSISSYLHVLHSKRHTTELDDETFNALVDYQLSSKEPIRAPWFRTAEQQAARVSMRSAILCSRACTWLFRDCAASWSAQDSLRLMRSACAGWPHSQGWACASSRSSFQAAYQAAGVQTTTLTAVACAKPKLSQVHAAGAERLHGACAGLLGAWTEQHWPLRDSPELPSCRACLERARTLPPLPEQPEQWHWRLCAQSPEAALETRSCLPSLP